MTPNGSVYRVIISAKLVGVVKQLHDEAAGAGFAEPFLTALIVINQRLQNDPFEFGEPLYRLPLMKLQVRTAAVFPLNVHYAVHEEKPVVFIKDVRLIAWI